MTQLRPVPDPEVNEVPEWAMPLDFAILGLLPKQGSRLGYHVLGATVRAMRDQLNEPLPQEAWVTSDQISARIRQLSPHGMVVKVKVMGAGGSAGYQITQLGEQLLALNPEENA